MAADFAAVGIGRAGWGRERGRSGHSGASAASLVTGATVPLKCQWQHARPLGRGREPEADLAVPFSDVVREAAGWGEQRPPACRGENLPVDGFQLRAPAKAFAGRVVGLGATWAPISERLGMTRAAGAGCGADQVGLPVAGHPAPRPEARAGGRPGGGVQRCGEGCALPGRARMRLPLRGLSRRHWRHGPPSKAGRRIPTWARRGPGLPGRKPSSGRFSASSARESVRGLEVGDLERRRDAASCACKHAPSAWL